MDDDDRAPISRGDAASRLSAESLERYSLAELDARVALLEAEIGRVGAHRNRAAAHLRAADSLFAVKPK
jgi:uncharacterized small protein (DUF1192 family)